MKIKRLLAAAAASVVAVSAMAIVASAVDVDIKVESPAEGGKPETNAYKFADQLAKVTDGSKVAKIEVDMQCSSGYFNGFMGANDKDGTWYDSSQITTEVADKVTWTWETTKGISPDSFKVEFWWVNPVYGAVPDGSPEGTKAPIEGPGVITISAIRVLDADGNDLCAAAAPSTSSTPSNSGDNSGSQSSGDNVNTGVEGVAAVVGVAALAGAALVVARKRK